jgi:hypothetical protein
MLMIHMNSAINCDIKRYKECAGKGCNKIGKMLLKIGYIHKTGYFCESCAADLLHLGIATKEGEVI